MKQYKVGDIITGYVTGIEKYGIFVSIDEQYNGLIHISEISDSYVRNIHDFVKVGEQIKAKVIDEDISDYRIKLSIKNIEYSSNPLKNSKIEETKSGFLTLGNMLNQWIEEKNEEIRKKIKKN